MVDAVPDFDVEAVLAEMLEYLTVQPDGNGDDVWIGAAPEWYGELLFGGFVVGQAIVAATRNPPPGRLHSLHAYFLKPVVAGQPLIHEVTPIRTGRAFSSRHVTVSQSDKPVFDMTCSFTTDVDGYVYDLPNPRPVPRPDELPLEQGMGAFLAAFVGPTPPSPDGTRESTYCSWFRIPAELPDDEHLHTALLGMASDWTGLGGRPLHLDGDIGGMVSLDHAVWFHRPARVEDWLLFDVHSLVNAGGRGLFRGVMRDEAGLVVLSIAQEMRLTPVL